MPLTRIRPDSEEDWNVLACIEADAIENRLRRLAKSISCEPNDLLAAVQYEILGRFLKAVYADPELAADLKGHRIMHRIAEANKKPPAGTPEKPN